MSLLFSVFKKNILSIVSCKYGISRNKLILGKHKLLIDSGCNSCSIYLTIIFIKKKVVVLKVKYFYK